MRLDDTKICIFGACRAIVYDFAVQDALDLIAPPQALRVTLDIRGNPEIFFDDALTRLAASHASQPRAPRSAAQPPGDGTLVTAQYLIGNERSLFDSRSHGPANYGSLPKTGFFNGILDLHIPTERRRGPLWGQPAKSS